MPKATGHLTSVPSVSPLHNLSAGDLVDQLGSLKAELIARGLPDAEGAMFRATVSQSTRWTLDVERVRAEMGDGWCDARSKVAAVTTVRVSARTGSRKAA